MNRSWRKKRLETAIVLLTLTTAGTSVAAEQAAKPPPAAPQAVKNAATGQKGEMDARQIMARMKSALEPQRTSVRQIEFILTDSLGNETNWTAFEARKRVEDSNRFALTMLEPPSLRGSSMLVYEHSDMADAQWIYLPALQRVRKIVPVTAFQPFLGTDFTFSDLGFVDLSHRTFRLVAINGTGDDRTYEVEEVPTEQWYYSRIVNLISAKTFLPVRRDFYSPAGDLWKQEFFESVRPSDGILTPHVIRMVDIPNGGSTELHIVEARYDEKVPDDVFDPEKLPTLASRPLWRETANAGAGQKNTDQAPRS